MLTSKEIAYLKRIEYLENKKTPNRKARRAFYFDMNKPKSAVSNNRRSTPGRVIQVIGKKVIRHKIAA